MSEACKLCRGACCESLLFPINGDIPSHVEFYDIRARLLASNGKPTHAEVEARCPKLLKSGKCSCYATRPQECQTFAVGSLECRFAVKYRRPESKAKAIFAILNAPFTQPK